MASTTSTYALLVAIDEYPPPVNPLRGCVNDIRRIETMLQERLKRQDDQPHPFKPLILTNQQATRQAIIDGFRNHLCLAGKDDVALFYYSGHGSQAPSPPEFWHLEPDRLDETLVCWDSRLPGANQWDLADKELAQLITEVADTGAHVAVILDCCHSGSGTRELDEPGVRSRRLPTDDRIRPIETFLVDAQQATALSEAGRAAGGNGGWYQLPRGRHVVLSACSAEETAKELYLGGEQRGAFSFYLLETLQRATGNLSYRDLFKRVNALVRAGISLQSPQMEATETDDLAQPFLGGVIPAGPAYFTASFDRQRGWVIDGGAVHGLPAPTNGETTLLSLFPFDADVGDLHNLTTAVGEASISKVFAGQSAVAITLRDNQPPDPQMTYKAVVTALPLPPLVVHLDGDEAGLALVRTTLANANNDGGPSLLVREGEREEAELLVRAAENAYRIRRKGDGYALVVETRSYTPPSAQLVVQRLEHIARWRKIVELANPGSRLSENAVRLDVEVPAGQGGWRPAPVGSAIRLQYYLRDGQWQQPTFRVKLTNTSNLRLYCMAFDLTESYGVYPILPGGGVWLDAGQETWANAGEPFYASVPDELWKAGAVQFNDTLLLVVSTDESDATQLAQDDLPVTVAVTRSAKGINRLSTLNRLMHRVGSRTFGTRPANTEPYSDWNTATVSFTTVRPQETEAIAPAGAKTSFIQGVTIQGHPVLKARARLTNLPDVSRDVGNRTLPAILRDRPDVAQPFEFSASRGGEPGLSVLELVDVENPAVVTPENPLVVEINAPLKSDELLLSLADDGEFFIPLGRVTRSGEGVTVALERLPPPSGTRSPGGSIKILFQKLVGQPLGFAYDYPQLAVATVDRKGHVEYHKAPAFVREAVAQLPAGEPILLYVHGILGDTRALACSAHTDWLKLHPAVTGLADRYKLILTFDYENLHTPIEENARLLKQRLEEAGLGANHDKRLHIVAHSMGGLVSRWFIEQEGGNQVVERLVMLGTPNGGSPWPTVQDWATVALGVGLNSLSVVAWPMQALGLLVAALETVDVALDQMTPGSEFLTKLADSPDPGVPYVIIAGNTSVIAAALTAEAGKPTRLIDRLWARVKPQKLLHNFVAPVFFGEPNDVAVAVASIKSVPGGRSSVSALEAPCDHLTYFTTNAGLDPLNKAL
jgi:pimeloyl-ACP methyl ester carboxylesterase